MTHVYILMLNLLSTKIITCFMYVTCTCLYFSCFERREILDQSNFDAWSMRDVSKQNKLQQKCHQVGFFKKYYVLGFFENLAVFLFWFKTGNKKERQFRILLVFGAAKLLNSCNLVLGRWYKTNTLEIHIHILGVRYFTCSCFYRLLEPSCS